VRQKLWWPLRVFRGEPPVDLLIIILVAIALVAASGLRVANQYHRAVVLRLGQFQAIRGPGLYWLIPLIEWQFRVDLRTVTAAVEEQETITKNDVPAKINAVVSLIKTMTGGDQMTARFMRKDFFDFYPQFKLFVSRSLWLRCHAVMDKRKPSKNEGPKWPK
jgi:hypothetical protein